MSGKIFAWTNLFISVIAILGDWTAVGLGVAGQHHKLFHQDEYQSSDDSLVNNAADFRDGGQVKDSSVQVNEEETPSATGDGYEDDPPIPSVYRTRGSSGVGKDDADESELATRYNFDTKRGSSSYKLKYGGLGKRKLSSNSLRYGGLGKRLGNDERATENEEAQERELGNEKQSLETAYLFLAKPYPDGRVLDDAVDGAPASTETAYDTDHPEIPLRQQRSRKGSGMRYAGLGKRRLKM